jgi:hypothetical protein
MLDAVGDLCTFSTVPTTTTNLDLLYGCYSTHALLCTKPSSIPVIRQDTEQQVKDRACNEQVL